MSCAIYIKGVIKPVKPHIIWTVSALLPTSGRVNGVYFVDIYLECYWELRAGNRLNSDNTLVPVWDIWDIISYDLALFQVLTNWCLSIYWAEVRLGSLGLYCV